MRVFGFDDQAHLLVGLIAHIAQQRRLLGLHQIGQIFDQARFLHLVGDFADDDAPLTAAQIFDFVARPGADRTAPGLIGVENGALAAFDADAAGREVRTGDEFHQLGHRRVRLGQQLARGVDQFDDIVRRDRRRHADGDAHGAVGQQIREAARQHDRFFILFVVGRPEVDGVFVYALG